MPNSRNIAAIILAAGFSKRMGRFKPLLKFGENTAIELVVDCFIRAGIDDITVVTGYQSERIIEIVQRLKVKTVFNRNFCDGMYSSIQAGVAKLQPEVEAFFLLPVDYPLVTHSTLERLTASFRSSGKGIVYPKFSGRRGHPPLITATYFTKIMQEPAPNGLQGLLTKYEYDALDVSVQDEAVLMDMDVEEDYMVLLQHLVEHDLHSERGDTTRE